MLEAPKLDKSSRANIRNSNTGEYEYVNEWVNEWVNDEGGSGAKEMVRQMFACAQVQRGSGVQGVQGVRLTECQWQIYA